MRRFHIDANMETIEMEFDEPLILATEAIEIGPQRCYVKPDGAFTDEGDVPAIMFRFDVPGNLGPPIILHMSATTLKPVVQLLRKMGSII
jgi:hypothetical protein